MAFFGQVAEWLKATDCKSVLLRVRRFESFPAHNQMLRVGLYTSPGARSSTFYRGSSSAGRASAFQAEGREFESRLPLY